jgi:hypothetical protein
VVGAAAFAFTIGSSDQASQQRYRAIFDPQSDVAYEIRMQRWESVLAEADDHPFGEGLGTAGGATARYGRYRTLGAGNFDSSYLKIALEQGLVVMAFFIAALGLLLAGLAWRAIRTPDPVRAGLAIGASGVLAGMMVLFYFGTYIEGLTALASWILVGLGVAQFSSRPVERGAVPARPPAPASATSSPSPVAAR